MTAARTTSKDWPRAQALWERGLGYSAVRRETGIPASSVRARAIQEGWQRPDGSRADGRDPDPDYVPMDPTATVENSTPLAANRARTAAASARREQRSQELRDDMAIKLLEDALRMRGQLFAEIEYVKPMAINRGSSGGDNLGQEVELVRYTTPTPSFRDQQAIATSTAILIDKALLLMGEVTERTESLVRDPQLRRERLQTIRDELAERREAAAAATS